MLYNTSRLRPRDVVGCAFGSLRPRGREYLLRVLSVLPHFTAERVWRAKFSAVTEREVRGAWAHLAKPSAAEAAAVDARQELDLKVGVSFTRLLTRALRDAARKRFAMPSLRLLSYGPCQTPVSDLVYSP